MRKTKNRKRSNNHSFFPKEDRIPTLDDILMEVTKEHFYGTIKLKLYQALEREPTEEEINQGLRNFLELAKKSPLRKQFLQKLREIEKPKGPK